MKLIMMFGMMTLILSSCASHRAVGSLQNVKDTHSQRAIDGTLAIRR